MIQSKKNLKNLHEFFSSLASHSQPKKKFIKACSPSDSFQIMIFLTALNIETIDILVINNKEKIKEVSNLILESNPKVVEMRESRKEEYNGKVIIIFLHFKFCFTKKGKN
jgi:hypothetical protein